MDIPSRSFIQALVFLILVGPLQAQQVFACGMMDATFYDDCCCEDLNNCANADCSDAITTVNNQCCEESIELTFYNEANEELIVIKSYEIRSNVDPPPAITSVFEQLVEPIRFIETRNLYSSPPCYLGSNTYLITQRLRI